MSKKDEGMYRQCSMACNRLMARGGIFTEIEVIHEARKAQNVTAKWRGDNLREAMRVANQVLGTRYRERKVARFGPIAVPGMPEADYARIGSKIAYTGVANGPDSLSTPNGDFPRLMIENDQVVKQGRRYGTNRNDLEPWEAQDIHVVKTAVALSSPKELELQANLDAAHERIHTLERELERIRGATPELDVWEIIKELRGRLDALEGDERFSPAA